MVYPLFPYSYIPRGSRIIIYGAGYVGQEYYAQCSMSGYADIVKWIDRDYVKYSKRYRVESTDFDYSGVEFDYILIALSKRAVVDKVKGFLLEHGVPTDKIIWVPPIFEPEKDKTYKYKLSVAAIMKDEEPYVIEWLEYHMCVGISHFYIYDNSDDFSMADLLDQYIKSGVVTLIHFPGIAMQMKAYMNAIESYKDETEYMAFIDGDEFIIPVAEGKVDEIVDSIFHQYTCFENEEYSQGIRGFAYLEGQIPGGLGVNWREYGTSGHKSTPQGLVLENYLYRGDDESNAHIKSIVNPRVVEDFWGPHAAKYAYGYCCISENGSIIPRNFFPDGQCEKIRINHYRTKSEEEMINKVNRGRATTPINDQQKNERIQLFEAGIENKNAMYDPIALKYVPVLKKRLGIQDI